jgi:hypothetical protein
MNDEVRKAVRSLYADESDNEAWLLVCAELTRLAEIADAVDPLVVRLHEVTTKLEAANAEVEQLRERVQFWHNSSDDMHNFWQSDKDKLEAANALLRESLPRIGAECAERHVADLVERIQAQLSESGHG